VASLLSTGYRPTLSYAVYLTAAAAMILISVHYSGVLLSLFPASPILAIQTVVLALYFQGVLMLAAPRLSKVTLPFLGLYILTSLMPPIANQYFNGQVSSSFVQLLTPVLQAAGYPVAMDGTLLVFESSTTSFQLLIDSAAAGIPAYATFIFLTALVQLHFRLDVKRTISLAACGLGALLLLAVGRTVLFVHLGYTYGSTALTGLFAPAGSQAARTQVE